MCLARNLITVQLNSVQDDHCMCVRLVVIPSANYIMCFFFVLFQTDYSKAYIYKYIYKYILFSNKILPLIMQVCVRVRVYIEGIIFEPSENHLISKSSTSRNISTCGCVH